MRDIRGENPDNLGDVAQLGEHLPCTQGVKGSNPFVSTIGGIMYSTTYYVARQGLKWVVVYDQNQEKGLRAGIQTFWLKRNAQSSCDFIQRINDMVVDMNNAVNARLWEHYSGT